MQDPAKIYEVAQSLGALTNLDARRAIDHAIEIGRGGTRLQLTEEQYRKLKTP